MSIDENQIVLIKRLDKAVVKPKPLSQPVLLPEVQQPEIEQPEQPEPVVQMESLAEPSREESVCGSGFVWQS